MFVAAASCRAWRTFGGACIARVPFTYAQLRDVLNPRRCRPASERQRRFAVPSASRGLASALHRAAPRTTVASVDVDVSHDVECAPVFSYEPAPRARSVPEPNGRHSVMTMAKRRGNTHRVVGTKTNHSAHALSSKSNHLQLVRSSSGRWPPFESVPCWPKLPLLNPLV